MKFFKKNKYKILASIIVFIAYYFFPYKLEGYGYYHKIWAHRVNSIEKLDSALKYYDGVELDLVFNKEGNFLDVNHLPSKSIGLSFESYLSSLQTSSYPYMWLDIKNLHKDNSNIILNRLLSHFKKRNYPLDKVLIESKNPKELIIFEKAGFKTSFYIPNEIYLKNPADISIEISKIKETLKRQPNMAISTNFKNYRIIKSEFPNHKKYIWALVKPIHFQHLKIREILKDESVKSVLLNYHAIRGNR